MGHKNLNVKQEIENQYKQSQQKYAELEQLLRTQYGVDQQRSNQLYDQTKSGYEGYLGPTGGLNPNYVTGIEGDIAGLRALAANGGLNEEAMARFRGNGFFDELVKTGGYTEADKSNIRSRATSVIPSMFDATKNIMSSQNAAQGGYSPGYTMQVAKASREAGRGASDAARNAEIGINESVREGKNIGAVGMSNAENALQTLRTGNMFKGYGMAGDMSLGLGESIRSGQEYGQSGLAHMWENESEAQLGNIAMQMKAWGMSDEQLGKLLSLYPQGRSVWNKLLKAGIIVVGVGLAGPSGGVTIPASIALAGQV